MKNEMVFDFAPDVIPVSVRKFVLHGQLPTPVKLLSSCGFHSHIRVNVKSGNCVLLVFVSFNALDSI